MVSQAGCKGYATLDDAMADKEVRVHPTKTILTAQDYFSWHYFR